MRALTANEVQRLLDACHDPPLRTIIHTAVTTGLRLGELLGLQWRDLDFTDGTATIRRAAQYLPDAGVTLRPPKTARGRRTIALSAETICTLTQIVELDRANAGACHKPLEGLRDPVGRLRGPIGGGEYQILIVIGRAAGDARARGA